MDSRCPSPPSLCRDWSFTLRWESLHQILIFLNQAFGMMLTIQQNKKHGLKVKTFFFSPNIIHVQIRVIFQKMFFSFVCFLQLGLSPLLFCEDDADERVKESSTPAAAAEPSPQEETDATCKPRLCSLRKGPLGFGFNLGCVPHTPGTFISQVSMAERTRARVQVRILVFFCQMWL